MRKRQAKKIQRANNRGIRRYRKTTYNAAFRAIVKARRRIIAHDMLSRHFRYRLNQIGQREPESENKCFESICPSSSRQINDNIEAVIRRLCWFVSMPIKVSYFDIRTCNERL